MLDYNVKEVDTHGIYDDCPCGERPHLNHKRWREKLYQVACDSCGMATDWKDRTDVMLDWNHMCRNEGKLRGKNE